MKVSPQFPFPIAVKMYNTTVKIYHIIQDEFHSLSPKSPLTDSRTLPVSHPLKLDLDGVAAVGCQGQHSLVIPLGLWPELDWQSHIMLGPAMISEQMLGVTIF